MRLFTISPETFIRNIDAGDLLENFLIASVSTVLGIRFFLFITGYPSIGGDDLHIAHMLWGGLLMFLSMVLLMVFLNRSVYNFASVLGGIGFGTFIDEIGKFVTRDNNYFFQPAVAVLYIIFVVLYLFIRYIDSRKTFSEREYLLNALEVIKEAIQNDMDKKEKRLALHYLEKCKSDDTFIKDLRDILNKADLKESPHPTVFSRIRLQLHRVYMALIRTRWFVKGTLLIFGMSAVLTLFNSFIYAYGLGSGRLSYYLEDTISFSTTAQLISSSVASLLILFGAVIIFNNRLRGFELLKFSVLISIFFTQVFLFYDHQFQALTGFIWNIFLYVVIQYYINEEKTLQRSKAKQ